MIALSKFLHYSFIKNHKNQNNQMNHSSDENDCLNFDFYDENDFCEPFEKLIIFILTLVLVKDYE